MAASEKSKKQAHKIVDKLRISGAVKSLGSRRNFEERLIGLAEFASHAQLGKLKDVGFEGFVEILNARAQCVGQSTLNMERTAAQYVLRKKLPKFESAIKPKRKSRAHTEEQILAVMAAQGEAHRLSTRIVYETGLRGHELFTILPIAEQKPSKRDKFRSDRFFGCEDGVPYTVLGKGGLCNEIRLPADLAEQLEKLRLLIPIHILDRGIWYVTHYFIPGGKKWSDSYAKASQRVLGRGRGGHCIRHTFAQRRYAALLAANFLHKDALSIVSQQLGHFREDIVLKFYLR